MRWLLLPAALLLLLLLPSCVPKTAPVTLDTERPISVALVYDADGATPPKTMPEAVAAAVTGELEKRNLQGELLAADDFAEAFSRRRASEQRVEWLGKRSDGYVLLLEARVEYYNQLNSLFRWTVSMKATMWDGQGIPVQQTFEVPVFLRFAHQKEDEAMEAAGEVVKRRIGRLADTVLGADEGDGSSGAEGAEPPDDPVASPATASADGAGSDGLGPIYFVMVDRFFNGDHSNDGDADPSDPQAFHGGDLAGVRAKLDHLQQLGVETVWLSPVFAMRTEKIGEWGAYHGYWVTGETAVEPRFGTLAELRALRDELHERGMKLLLDVVTNHVGYEAALTREKPGWFHGNGDIANWGDEVEATTHDVHGLPDLAHEEPEVRAFLLEQALFWIDAVQPDGFRLDAVRHVPLDFWAWYTAEIKRYAGNDFVLLGELFDGSPAVVDRFWRQGGFTHMFDFPLHYALVEVACDGVHPGKLAAVLQQDGRYPDASKLVTFADNHDLPRVQSRCPDAAGRVLGLLESLRGVPSWLYGTEFGVVGAEEPANRPSLDWEAPTRRSLASDPLFRSPRAPAGGRVVWVGEEGLVLAHGTDTQLTTTAFGWGRAEVRLPFGPSPIQLSPGSKQSSTTVLGSGGASESLRALCGGSTEVGVHVRGAPEGQLRLVGAGRALGDWSPDRAPVVQEGLSFPACSVLEYKLVVRGEGGDVWEDRGNRYAHVGAEPLTLTLTWGG